MFGLPSLYVKLIGGLLVALLIVGLVADRGRWIRRAHGDEAQLSAICAATRAAADNPKLDCKLVPQQIAELARSVDTLKGALSDQTAKVTAQAAETKRQQAESSEALKTAVGRADKAEATRDRLSASSRSGDDLAKPCEPSKALEDAWK